MNHPLLSVEMGRDRRREMEDRADRYRTARAAPTRRTRVGERRRSVQTRVTRWARAAAPV